MITDPRVFEDDYLPRELMHRGQAVEHLSRAFEPATRGERARDVLITGPSGVGKTVLARHTLDRLADHADVDHAHVPCLGQTTGAVLRDILHAHPHVDGSEVAANAPVDDLRGQLRSAADRPVVVVLDEADGLHATDVLAELSAIPLVSLVVICHDPEEFLAGADAHVRDHLGVHVRLDRYGVDELAEILKARAIQGLPPAAAPTPQLRTLADEAAGVARVGIQALRAAAELAAERGRTQIADADVADAFERARHRIRASNLTSLPYHHQVLYALVHDAGGLSAGKLHERYDAVADAAYADTPATPIGKRSRRNKLRKLREYDLIDWHGPPQHRVYTVCDETIAPLESLSDLEL